MPSILRKWPFGGADSQKAAACFRTRTTNIFIHRILIFPARITATYASSTSDAGLEGSLEWAGIARERVGLDPLVKDYRKLGIGRHRMSYVCAPSERIPFQDEYFDFVTCFNALDHVDNIDETLSEIVRVLREGGSFLLITEINHPPTVTEPQTISEELLDRLARSFVPAQTRLSEIRSDHDVYGSLRENLPYNRESSRHPALLSARMIKRPAAA